ncbi:5-tetrahydropyridine-2,6-dicarboxylate N-acetyltransferase [Striga asiatica]|uniref:5-tetrahydropyridine-2,6-dicarboxylate N-acetyltransferase n=1 Tax=Striga asiatica TaxID=4170 RepID=A0A5A7PT09_STRAF|nr:5-tetrahydropyridine-2,6-dicarboxylate N-acetyltransferase [Striga asiatica]
MNDLSLHKGSISISFTHTHTRLPDEPNIQIRPHPVLRQAANPCPTRHSPHKLHKIPPAVRLEQPLIHPQVRKPAHPPTPLRHPGKTPRVIPLERILPGKLRHRRRPYLPDEPLRRGSGPSRLLPVPHLHAREVERSSITSQHARDWEVTFSAKSIIIAGRELGRVGPRSVVPVNARDFARELCSRASEYLRGGLENAFAMLEQASGVPVEEEVAVVADPCAVVPEKTGVLWGMVVAAGVVGPVKAPRHWNSPMPGNFQVPLLSGLPAMEIVSRGSMTKTGTLVFGLLFLWAL